MGCAGFADSFSLRSGAHGEIEGPATIRFGLDTRVFVDEGAGLRIGRGVNFEQFDAGSAAAEVAAASASSPGSGPLPVSSASHATAATEDTADASNGVAPGDEAAGVTSDSTQASGAATVGAGPGQPVQDWELGDAGQGPLVRLWLA